MSAFPLLTQLLDKLMSFGSLPRNWDGGRCEPVDPTAIYKGIQLLETVAISLSPQAVEPLANGRVQFRWESHKGHLILDIVPNRERYVYQIASTNPNEIVAPQEILSHRDLIGVIIRFLDLGENVKPANENKVIRPLPFL